MLLRIIASRFHSMLSGFDAGDKGFLVTPKDGLNDKIQAYTVGFYRA